MMKFHFLFAIIISASKGHEKSNLPAEEHISVEIISSGSEDGPTNPSMPRVHQHVTEYIRKRLIACR